MIESANNEKIKGYAKLNEKKYREEAGLFLIEGYHLVEEAYKKGIIKEIFILENETIDFQGIQTTIVTERVLKRLSSTVSPPKIIAVCFKLKANQIKGNIIISDDISDPGNLGTIIRSAVAFGYETIIVSSNTVDIYNSKVIRATEGMLFNINIIVANLSEMVKKLKDDGYLIVGTDVKTGTKPSPINQKHVLIIGSEARGMSDELLSLTDDNLCISMNPLCESLNAAVSASILMYQLSLGADL